MPIIAMYKLYLFFFPENYPLRQGPRICQKFFYAVENLVES